MKKAIEVESKFTQILTGYNEAEMTDLKTESFTANGKACTTTNIYFHVTGTADSAYEKFSLTNTEDEPIVAMCNMVLLAFGGKAIVKGDDPEPQLRRCIGKKIALLMIPQAPNKEGKVYHHVPKYGMVGQVPAVKPLASVGELFEYTAKEGDSKPAKTVEPKEDDTGF